MNSRSEVVPESIVVNESGMSPGSLRFGGLLCGVAGILGAASGEWVVALLVMLPMTVIFVVGAQRASQGGGIILSMAPHGMMILRPDVGVIRWGDVRDVRVRRAGGLALLIVEVEGDWATRRADALEARGERAERPAPGDKGFISVVLGATADHEVDEVAARARAFVDWDRVAAPRGR